MDYKNGNNQEESKFNKLNEPQENETTNSGVTTNGANEDESAEHGTHTHIPRKAKKKMKKEAALHQEEEMDSEEETDEETDDTEIQGGYEEGEEEEEGEYEEGEEQEEDGVEGKARGFFETLDETLHNIDTKKVAKLAAAGFLLVAGARKGGLLGGLALSVATGILAKEVLNHTSQQEEEAYEEEEEETMAAA